jgi:hypothetical protein
MGLVGVVREEKDVTIVAWVLGMHGCGLSITLQQLKMKVAKFHPNKTNIIQTWGLEQDLMVLV